MGHCEACPLAGADRCPSADHPSWCRNAARERTRTDPRQHYWLDRIRELAGRPAPKSRTLPDGFPRRDASPGKVRVGLACPVLYPAGAESHMMSLLRAVDRCKVSWRGLAVLGGAGSREPGISARFAEVLPTADGREAALALARECDLVIGWDLGDLPPLLKRASPSCKVAIVSHATDDSGWGRSAMSRLEGVDRVVAVSELAIGGDSGASVIWNAVDAARLAVDRSRAEMRRAWGVPDGAMVAGYYGRMSDEKGAESMGRAIGHLPPGWHAVVVGSGPNAAAVEAEGRRSGGSDRLHLVGPDHRAGDVLAAFDTLIVPSEYESFCLTMAEGLWAGVPVISTDVGIAKLAPGLTRPIPFGADGPTLARAILDDRADMRALAARVGAGMEFARERLAPGRFGREWTELILELAPRPAPPVAVRPEVAAGLRLARLRRECPHATRAGCGCQDLVACSKTGRDMTRAECYECLEAGG